MPQEMTHPGARGPFPSTTCQSGSNWQRLGLPNPANLRETFRIKLSTSMVVIPTAQREESAPLLLNGQISVGPSKETADTTFLRCRNPAITLRLHSLSVPICFGERP